MAIPTRTLSRRRNRTPTTTPDPKPTPKPFNPLEALAQGAGRAIQGAAQGAQRFVQGAASLLQPRGGVQDAASRLPEAPDVAGTLTPPGEEAVAATREAEEAQLASEEADKAESDRIAAAAEAGTETLVGDIETARAGLAAEAEEFEGRADKLEASLEGLPDEVRTEFEQVRDQFGDVTSAALSDVRGDRDEALAGVFQGQTAAAQAAIQGIQGNINQQVAAIGANPNLTAAQKQSMISQVRMQGALNLVPAIGATQLQFNTLAANTAAKFGAVIGQVQTAAIGGEAALGGAQAQATAAAFTATNRLGAEILGIRQNAAVAFASEQTQLLGMRGAAENMGNQFALAILPERETPFPDYSGSAVLNLSVINEILTKDISSQLAFAGLDIAAMSAEAMKGNPLTNFGEFLKSLFG